jgi:hypothetical protein
VSKEYLEKVYNAMNSTGSSTPEITSPSPEPETSALICPQKCEEIKELDNSQSPFLRSRTKKFKFEYKRWQGVQEEFSPGPRTRIKKEPFSLVL